MRVIENPSFARRRPISVRIGHTIRIAISSALSALKLAWSTAFPMPAPDGPDTPPNIAKAIALREAAQLAEAVDAASDKRVA